MNHKYIPGHSPYCSVSETRYFEAHGGPRLDGSIGFDEVEWTPELLRKLADKLGVKKETEENVNKM